MELKIEGMSCAHCVMHVKNAILSVNGASSVKVEIGRASFELDDPGKLKDIQSAIQAAGYNVVQPGDL